MIIEQLKIFNAFFVLGILFVFIFDFFRALRKTFKTNNFVTYFEDIIFLLIVSIMLYKSIIIFSSGELRLYIFIAIIIGIIIYFLTIGNLCAIMFKVILDFLKKFILCFIRILKIPIKFIIRYFTKVKSISLNKIFKNNS